LQDAIIGSLHILKRKVPVDRIVQITLIDLLGNLRQFAMTNITIIADDAGKENLLGWPGSLVLDLPMLKFVEEVCGVIHCR
jgi:hypothetical protein